ncbi:MAG TPA: hypothetical protein VFR17_05670 [Mycobacterium sp.]|nr:hypothetical protein [Mycobacterium sp.]
MPVPGAPAIPRNHRAPWQLTLNSAFFYGTIAPAVETLGGTLVNNLIDLIPGV